MKFKRLIPIILCLISFQPMFAQKALVVTNKDFASLIGSWQGTLTYLDYTSNKPFVMPADVQITQVDKTEMYTFANTYPQEPKANENDTIRFSQDRRLINNQLIKSRRKLSDGSLELITEYLATDGNDNKPAIIRHTYTIGKQVYINRKDVQFALHGDWIKRSEYAYKRKKSDGKL